MIKDIKEEIVKIYEKEFKNSLMGYSKNQVDEFLDEIAEFLEGTSKTLKDSEEQREDMIKENIVLKAQVIKLEEKLKSEITNKRLADREIEKKLGEMSKEIEHMKTMKLN